MIERDLKELVRERFLDDQKSLASKMRVREALSHLLAELDLEIANDQTLKSLGHSEDSTVENSNPSPVKNDSDPEQTVETFT